MFASSNYTFLPRLLPSHCCWRQLCETLGFEETEELQNPPAGWGLRGKAVSKRNTSYIFPALDKIITHSSCHRWGTSASTAVVLTWRLPDQMCASTFASSGTNSRYRYDTTWYDLKKLLLSVFFKLHKCFKSIPFQVLSEHTALATGVRFGGNSQFLVSASFDRTLKVYGSS